MNRPASQTELTNCSQKEISCCSFIRSSISLNWYHLAAGIRKSISTQNTDERQDLVLKDREEQWNADWLLPLGYLSSLANGVTQESTFIPPPATLVASRVFIPFSLVHHVCYLLFQSRINGIIAVNFSFWLSYASKERFEEITFCLWKMEKCLKVLSKIHISVVKMQLYPSETKCPRRSWLYV